MGTVDGLVEDYSFPFLLWGRYMMVTITLIQINTEMMVQMLDWRYTAAAISISGKTTANKMMNRFVVNSLIEVPSGELQGLLLNVSLPDDEERFLDRSG